jgi:hypothetical protein
MVHLPAAWHPGKVEMTASIRPLTELAGLCPFHGCRNISGTPDNFGAATYCVEHAPLRGPRAGDPPRPCAEPGCREPAQARASAKGRAPRYCTRHAAESQRRAAQSWRQRKQAAAYDQTADPTRCAVRQGRRALGHLGELVADFDQCLVALEGAADGKAADPALWNRLRSTANAALTEVVEAWRRFESLHCDGR